MKRGIGRKNGAFSPFQLKFKALRTSGQKESPFPEF
jgi:hypothetical protein